MVQVTYRSAYKVKQGRKTIQKVSEWTEQAPDEASAKLRAMALNWQIVKMEVV
jgi:hypothetical protein